MARKTVYLVQPFVAGKRRRPVPGTAQPATTGAGAVQRAERMAQRCLGAVALASTGDTATGDFDPPEVLAKFGEVPEEFLESLLA